MIHRSSQVENTFHGRMITCGIRTTRRTHRSPRNSTPLVAVSMSFSGVIVAASDRLAPASRSMILVASSSSSAKISQDRPSCSGVTVGGLEVALVLDVLAQRWEVVPGQDQPELSRRESFHASD